MAHAPYPWWHYAIDLGWGTCFAVAAFYAWKHLPRYRLAADVLAVLLASRFMGSCGALLLIFLELPLACVVIVVGLHAAFSPVRPAGEPRGASDPSGAYDGPYR
jgi:hypothetical protein